VAGQALGRVLRHGGDLDLPAVGGLGPDRGHITWLKVGALAINLLLVIYLVWTKRLFGVRGGKAAYDARLRSESVIEVEQAALAAALPGQPGLSTPVDAAVQPVGDKPPGRGAAAAGPETGTGPGRPRGYRRPGPAALPAGCS
jgi:hypothetical protein